MKNCYGPKLKDVDERLEKKNKVEKVTWERKYIKSTLIILGGVIVLHLSMFCFTLFHISTNFLDAVPAMVGVLSTFEVIFEQQGL